MILCAARSLLKVCCLAVVVLSPVATQAQSIAVYGAQNSSGLGTSLHVYDSSGHSLAELLFQEAVGSGSSTINPNVEDIAYDAAGSLYAVGKPTLETPRTIWKFGPGSSGMDILFQKDYAYDAGVDGSIAISPTGDIAVYGAQNNAGVGSTLHIYDPAGSSLQKMGFQDAVGSGTYSINPNVEDIAYDAAGNLYAVGEPSASTARTIWKSGPGFTQMDILFQKDLAYDASVDASIAISPTGNIAVCGAQNSSGLGSTVRIYDQAGNPLVEMLFQTSVGGGYALDLNVEDIAFDTAGNLYAVGKANSSTARTIWKSKIGLQNMDILFQKEFAYDAGVDGSIAVAGPASPWTSLGSSLGGTSGFPLLAGSGTLASNSSDQLSLVSARPSSTATLVFGLVPINAPFKGGVLVPNPLLTIPLATTPAGTASLPFVFPAGVPSGTALYFQFWVQDAAAIHGLAASNGLKGVTP